MQKQCQDQRQLPDAIVLDALACQRPVGLGKASNVHAEGFDRAGCCNSDMTNSHDWLLPGKVTAAMLSDLDCPEQTPT